MRGPRGAKELMATYLQESLPPYIELLRARWNLEFEDIPEVAVYLAHDPGQEISTWPTIAVTIGRTPRFRRIEELYGGDTLYEVTYAMRVFAWVRISEYVRTIEVRDDLIQSMVVLLLDYQTVDDYEQTTWVDENTLTVEYSDTPAVKGDRFVSGGFLAFDFKVEEKLQRTDRVHGSVGGRNEVLVDVQGYGPTQPAIA